MTKHLDVAHEEMTNCNCGYETPFLDRIFVSVRVYVYVYSYKNKILTKLENFN